MVCRISESLISLQQHGNSEYVGWALHFDCCEKDILNHLEGQAKRMEDDLADWKRAVLDYRSEFYELNNYTTHQLLILREELGRLRNSEASVSSHSETCIMLNLLHSISEDVTLERVRSELHTLASPTMQQTEVIPDRVDKKVPSDALHGKESKVVTAGSFSLQSSVSNQRDESKLLVEAGLVGDILSSTADDKPSISEADLTDVQRKMMSNIAENYGFSRKLILLGFERCNKPDIEDEVVDWCEDHAGEFKDGNDYESQVTVDALSEGNSSDGRY